MDQVRQQIRGEEQEVFRSIRKDVCDHYYPSFSPGNKVFATYTFWRGGVGYKSLGEASQEC